MVGAVFSTIGIIWTGTRITAREIMQILRHLPFCLATLVKAYQTSFHDTIIIQWRTGVGTPFYDAPHSAITPCTVVSCCWKGSSGGADLFHALRCGRRKNNQIPQCYLLCCYCWWICVDVAFLMERMLTDWRFFHREKVDRLAIFLSKNALYDTSVDNIFWWNRNGSVHRTQYTKPVKFGAMYGVRSRCTLDDIDPWSSVLARPIIQVCRAATSSSSNKAGGPPISQSKPYFCGWRIFFFQLFVWRAKCHTCRVWG